VRAKALRPAPADLIQQGADLLGTRNFEGALKLFEQARQAQPGNPDLGYLMGMALEQMGQLGAAIDAYRTCTSGPYAQIARTHVQTLAARLRR
jgi:Flp pilus assembly protein TadD